MGGNLHWNNDIGLELDDGGYNSKNIEFQAHFETRSFHVYKLRCANSRSHWLHLYSNKNYQPNLKPSRHIDD